MISIFCAQIPLLLKLFLFNSSNFEKSQWFLPVNFVENIATTIDDVNWMK